MIYKETLRAMDTLILRSMCIAMKGKGEVESDLRRRLQVSRLVRDRHVTERAEEAKLPLSWNLETSFTSHRMSTEKVLAACQLSAHLGSCRLVHSSIFSFHIPRDADAALGSDVEKYSLASSVQPRHAQINLDRV